MSDKSANPINSMLHLLMGTADVTKDKASDVAGSLLRMPGAGSAGQLTEQVAALAEDLMLVADTNRRLVFDAVRGELEGNLSRFGLATRAELSAATAETERLTAEVKRLRNALRVAGIEFADNADNRDYEILGYETQAETQPTPPASRPPRARASATGTSAARKAVVKKAAPSGTGKTAKTAKAAKPAGERTNGARTATVKKAAARRTGEQR